ncbi:VCBS repeat-containing protein [Streptomyces sp. NPDC002082]|uniref:VCBS repeat-containing protein n=1 Tax=Streptomyces sp. NPDC002082 TaxID=3154772 RepID=UPI0033207AC0
MSTSLGLIAAPSATAAGCTGGTESDFNGDGVRDIAIADPEATVAGKQRAGLVRVIYGGGKGMLELSQETAAVPGSAETDDQWGFSLATYDADKDGCTDLVVGAPFEDVGTAIDGGIVQVVYGSPTGLALGRAVTEYEQGDGETLSGIAENEDWVGYAITAGTSSAGTPFLAIGIPGEDIDTTVNAGVFSYVTGVAATVVRVTQDDTTPAFGAIEAHDRFGAALASNANHLAVGSPGEALGTVPFAGAAGVYKHTLTNGRPTLIRAFGQDEADVTSTAEPSDGFGTSLAIVPYRPAGATSTTESMLAVGAPGEDLATTVDAGAVQIFRVGATTVTETQWLDQNGSEVRGTAEPGDFFGQRLAAANTSPNTVGTATTMRLAVGVPGDEISDVYSEKGAVHIFPLLGEPGLSDAVVDPGAGIPAPAAAHSFAGLSLGGNSSALYVGMPYGPEEGRGLYAFPWNTETGAAPTASWKPGEGGIPAENVAFGAVAR